MKKVLLIAGGGSIGTYVAEECLRLGYMVDIICLEDKISDNENLKYYKADATIEYLKDLFGKVHYDGIVNFINYPNPEEYIPYHELLSNNTEHLIFISSYRVYGDLQHPITEDAPLLLDVIKDNKRFIEEEDYALSKAKEERYIKNSGCPENWTVARPVISFADKRFDLCMACWHSVIDAAKEKKTFPLPIEAKNLTAGLDWAGNSGKIIANLLFKECAIGEAYTISSAQNLTWGQVADIYTELLGVKIEWVPADYPENAWRWYYDRAYDRKIDNSKVLKATGLKPSDFKSIREGVRIELEKIGAI